MGTKEYIQELIKRDIENYYDDPYDRCDDDTNSADAKEILEYINCMISAAKEYDIDFEQYINEHCTPYTIKRVQNIVKQCEKILKRKI